MGILYEEVFGEPSKGKMPVPLMVSLLSPATVVITASDPNDPYNRDWNIYTSFPGTPILTAIHSSEDTWAVDLAPGTYYFNVGQTGGPAYGTYSGTINGVPFSGVDASHAAQFTVGGVGAVGSINAIRIQDIPRNLWFSWDKGVGWSPGTPVITPGTNTLYIAFWAINGGAAGNLTLTTKDDTGALLATKTAYAASGGGVGSAEWTGNMPSRSYGITLGVTP